MLSILWWAGVGALSSSSERLLLRPLPLHTTSASTPHRRPLPSMLAERCPLESEELQALAGIWSASLELDDGARQFSCLLNARGKLVPADLSEMSEQASFEASLEASLEAYLSQRAYSLLLHASSPPCLLSSTCHNPSVTNPFDERFLSLAVSILEMGGFGCSEELVGFCQAEAGQVVALGDGKARSWRLEM